MSMKFADAESWGNPTHSAQRAKAILDAAYTRMQADLPSIVNPSFTKAQVHGIFSESVVPKLPNNDPIHPQISKNIEREFGRYFKVPLTDKVAQND